MPITCTTTACNVNTYCLLYLSLSHTQPAHTEHSLSRLPSLSHNQHTQIVISTLTLSLFPLLSLFLSHNHHTERDINTDSVSLPHLSHNHYPQNVTSTLTISLSPPPLSLLPLKQKNTECDINTFSLSLPPRSLTQPPHTERDIKTYCLSFPPLLHNHHTLNMMATLTAPPSPPPPNNHHTQNMTSTLTAPPPPPHMTSTLSLSLPYLSHNHTQNVTSTHSLSLPSLSHTHHTQNMTLTLTIPPPRPPPCTTTTQNVTSSLSMSLPPFSLSLSLSQAPHTEHAINTYCPPPPTHPPLLVWVSISKTTGRTLANHSTFSGLMLASAIRVMGRADVLEAKMQCSGMIWKTHTHTSQCHWSGNMWMKRAQFFPLPPHPHPTNMFKNLITASDELDRSPYSTKRGDSWR